MKFSADTRKLLDELEQVFLVPLDIDESEFAKITKYSHAPYDEIGKTFQHNLRSVVSMVAFPFTLAFASAYQQHFMRIRMAERIRAGGIVAEEGETNSALEARRNAHALAVAREKMEEFRQTDDGIELVTSEMCNFLMGATEDGQLTLAASDLLLQGTSLTWGAFEVLARDVFVTYLNKTPGAVNKLVENPSARNKFELPKFSVEDLAKHGFDVSASMGTLLSRQQDLSDLRTIKSVYSALFPPPNPLAEKLNEDDLWVLSQQRHLIVHQRGIIDERYKENTRSKADIGARLVIPPNELERHLKLVWETGSALLEVIHKGQSTAET